MDLGNTVRTQRARMQMALHRPVRGNNAYGLPDDRCVCGRAWPCHPRQHAQMLAGEPPWWIRLAGRLILFVRRGRRR